jgi:predicted AlkP superfamily pyrophosphatase or phosphodiesterase
MNRRTALQLICSGALAAQTRGGGARHVVLISLDGLAAYALADPSVPLPTLRRMAKDGAWARAMEPVNPTVTWPNHTSMVTGVAPARHSVLYNGLAVRGGPGEPLKVEPWVDKPELVKSPTVYDLAHAAGLTTAEVDWVAIHNASTIKWAFPERPRMTDPIVKEMIAAGKVTEADIRDFAKAPIGLRDEVWTQAGEHIIEKHRPNLLLFHLLTTDSSQHRYGARSLGGTTALTLADARVARLLEALKRAGIYERTTVMVVSDHGFKTYKKLLHPNALLKAKGLDNSVYVIPEGGTAMVYVTRPERKAELLPVLKSTFEALAGVKEVVGPEQFDKLGYPQPAKNDRMADLVLAAAEGHSFSGSREGESITDVPAGSTPGSHGYLNTDRDMDAAFVAFGAGIKPGVTLDRIRNVDVAATIARILGLEMKDVDGRVLNEILR